MDKKDQGIINGTGVKKIGILTQHLHNNYGGLIQAYALQYFLIKHGFEVITVDFSKNKAFSTTDFKNILKNVFKKYVLNKKIHSINPNSVNETRRVAIHTNRFKQENIRLTHKITDIKQLEELKYYKFDALIVGSDQVWRPAYSPGMDAFFINFLNETDSIKRISYAASFGIDNCDEFAQSELVKYGKLLKKFDGISVREDSAIELCRKHFSVNALQVLDPTLLLEPCDYIELVRKDKVIEKKNLLMSYVLDSNPETTKQIKLIAESLKLNINSVMPENKGDIFPPVTDWLSGFLNADFVVTDSFHGTVFSIIFNKPFISITNSERGSTRFTSLLKTFRLEDRLITSLKEIDMDIVNKRIDYEAVNQILSEKKQFSTEFLLNALKD